VGYFAIGLLQSFRKAHIKWSKARAQSLPACDLEGSLERIAKGIPRLSGER